MLAMRYEVFPMAGYDDEWVAQAVDPDGAIYRAIFDGCDAKDRAEEYAAWKNAEPMGRVSGGRN